MFKDFCRNSGKAYQEPIKWCRSIIKVAYITVALIVLAHVIWFFAARRVLAWPADIYVKDYILFPAVVLTALTFLVDRLVNSPHIPLTVKEYLSLFLFIVYSFYLFWTHDIAKVLLASCILPIFASTLFSNVKITRWMFWMSCLAAILLGLKLLFNNRLDSSALMEVFVVCFMYYCSYLLAKLLIRYGHDHLETLMIYNNRQQSMEEQLKLDPFTGLYNKKTFDNDLLRFSQECKGMKMPLSLAMFDIDHFKNVNDYCGHAAGDRVLLYLAQILQSVQAENIHAFRMGGDEFSLLFKDCYAEEAARICEEVRQKMALCPMRAGDEKSITISCGIACGLAVETLPDPLTIAADSALYLAKTNGRDRVVIGANAPEKS